MVSNFAIVVDNDTAKPPAEPGCAYQVPLDQSDAPVYQCYTQAQWDARNAALAQQQAQQDAANAKWWHDHHAQVIGGGIAFVVLFVVIAIIYDKRHPKDQYGFRY